MSKSIQHKLLRRHALKQLLALCYMLSATAFVTAQQVLTTIDTTNIRIGEQVTYGITVEADTTQVVVFPATQALGGMEVIESYPVDTTALQEARHKLHKKYALSQWDSGRYLIPKQKIIVGEKTFFSDSAVVEVANVKLDTINQGLYDIKDPIQLPKDYSSWLQYALYLALVGLVILAFLFWLLRRHKQKVEKERYIPPFEQAMSTLAHLDESDLLGQSKYKDYYTQLTDALRQYYEEKVYDRALESTTSELVTQLQAERDAGHIDFSPETIKRLEDVLKRADMVKFARVYPEQGKALADRQTIEEVIKETKEVLPEPSEEDLLKDEAYREALSRKRKRKLYLSAAAGIVGILLIATTVAVLVKGYDEVRDFVFGNPTRELAEGTWITSEYGAPSMVVSTPKVLVRTPINLPEEMQGKVDITAFAWESKPRAVTVMLSQAQYPPKTELNAEQIIDGNLKGLESQGASFAIVKNDKFTTPNGAEGLKTFGSGTFKDPATGVSQDIEYTLLTFLAESYVQQLIITWNADDAYSDQIARRIVASVELTKGDE